MVDKNRFAKNIRFVNINDIDVDENIKNILGDISVEYSNKLKQQLQNEFEATVHIKEHKKKGKQHLYEVHSRINYPGDTIASESNKWDIIVAIRDTLEDINTQIKNKFKEE